VKYAISKKDGAARGREAAKILPGLPIDFHSPPGIGDTAAISRRGQMSLADAVAAALVTPRKERLDIVPAYLEFKPWKSEIKITG